MLRVSGVRTKGLVDSEPAGFYLATGYTADDSLRQVRRTLEGDDRLNET